MKGIEQVTPIANANCYTIIPLSQSTVISEKSVGVHPISDQNCLECVLLQCTQNSSSETLENKLCPITNLGSE